MPKKILLIDDDDLVVKTFKKLLSLKGYDVKTASSAVEAIAQAAVVEFDLVVSDVRMPGENGVVAIEKIKNIYNSKKIICGYVLISGYAEEDTPSHAVRLGVDKFLYKPIDSNEFLNAVSQELELVKQERELKSPSKIESFASFPKIEKELKERKRVVITGIGVVSPNGIGKDAYWDGLSKGTNCVDRISFFDPTDFPSKAAAEIRDFDPKKYIPEHNEIKRMGRSSHLAVTATRLAVEDAGLEFKEASKKEIGVIVGSAVSGLEYVELDFRALERGGVRKVRPFLGIAGFGGAISSEISRALGVQGISLTLSTGCTSSTDAMGYAFNLIRDGKTTLLITGGADACVTPGILAAFCQMGAVSFWQDNLSKASRPFNKDRAGFVIGEGSWIFVFEELSHAQERKAKIYGEVLGYGATCDAWHMAKPHPSGEHTARAIQMAIADSGMTPYDIDLFEAYGNGTPVNDSYETGVVKRVFGDHAFKIMMPSLKSMLGHPLGASGSQQVAGAMLAFNKGIVHPTINYEIPDPECDLDYVPNKARFINIKAAVCSSIAFGAKNSAIVVKAFQA